MNISVIGLGYVGTVTAACIAEKGHKVIAVDVKEVKVSSINKGISPILEKDIGDYVLRNTESGRLNATNDIEKAILSTDISIVCVGTPSLPNGNEDLSYIEKVCGEIGESISKKEDRHIVVIRSTILPGTMKNLVIPRIEESSGKKYQEGFGVVHNPEFLREGSSIEDYFNPPRIVVGTENVTDAETVLSLYEGIDAPVFITGFENSEMIKFADNSFHALKVCFANEIGNICKKVGADSFEVMDIFCSDTKLNLSPYYLKPGFAFGGSCLPKDIRALQYKAKELDLEIPLLSSIMHSNDLQVKHAIDLVSSKKKKNIAVIGLTFKDGTDDTRESPMISLIETLIGKGHNVRVYDHQFNLAKLIGANKEYVENHIEHISQLLVDDIVELIDFADLIIVGKSLDESTISLLKDKKDKVIIDFVSSLKDTEKSGDYEGICW